MTETGWVGPPRAHLELLYGQMKASLDEQIKDFEVLDKKGTTLLTPVGLLLGFALTGLPTVMAWPMAPLHLYQAGLLALALAFLAGVYSLQVRDVATAPSATGLWPDYSAARSEELLVDVCTAIADAYQRNARIRGLKTPWIRLQFWLLILAALLLSAVLALRWAGVD